MEAFIVYEGNQWLSNDSLRIKAVCTTFNEAVLQIRDNHLIDPSEILELEEYDERDDFDVWEEVATEIEEQLREYRQTQGYSTNYLIEEREMNVWD